jgi:hypothetical protein
MAMTAWLAFSIRLAAWRIREGCDIGIAPVDVCDNSNRRLAKPGANCLSPCEEYDDLKQATTEYRRSSIH